MGSSAASAAETTGANPSLPVWRNVTPANTPAYTQDSSMTFDSARNRAVLLHADTGTYSLRTWDGNAWTGQVLAGATPGPSMRTAPIAYDTANDRIVLFGGFDGGRRNDTWSWNGTSATWLDLAPAQKPSVRNGHAMVYDSARHRLVMTGGLYCFVPSAEPCAGTWEFDGTNWAQIPGADYTPARWRHALAYDAGRGVVVMFGGANNTYAQAYADTWEYDGTAWTRRTSANGLAPSARYSHTMAYDSTRRKVVLYGGAGVATEAAHWEWDGENWTPVAQPAVNPGQRQRHAMTYDSARQRLVLTGNFSGWGNSPNEVWELAYETPPGVTTTTLLSDYATSMYGQSVVFTATVAAVAPATAVPTGTVAFLAGGTAIAGCAARPLDSAGVATCTTSAFTAGAQVITAQYGGDANYPPVQPVSNALSLQVQALPTVISISASPASIQFSQALTLAAQVTINDDSAHPAIAGTVSFSVDEVVVPGCDALPVQVSGVQCAVSGLEAGTHSVASAFTPSHGNILASTSSAHSVNIAKASTALTLLPPAQPITLGQSASIGASVSVIAPAAGSPGGTIAVSDDSGASCSIAWPQQTACALTPASAGTRQLSATFTPDAAASANFQSSSAQGQLIVNRATQAALNLTANPAELIPGMSSRLIASGGSGTGALTYAVDSGACSMVADIVTAQAAGNCIVRATKAGDTNYEAGSVAATLVVHPALAPEADAQAISVNFNTAKAIQLAGRDTNPGGPYALTYRIVTNPVNGAISNFDTNTGALTYTPASGQVAADSFTFTASSTNGTSQPATVALSITPPQLTLHIEDGSDFARYGRVINYVVTLTNTGVAANAVPVTFTLSTGLDAEHALLECIGADAGAHCVADTNNPLRYVVTLPPQRALTWLVSVPVRADAAGEDVRFSVTATGAGSLTDINTLVIFRDGFDMPYGAGTQLAPVMDSAPSATMFDDPEDVAPAVPHAVLVPSRAMLGALPAALLRVHDGDHEVRIEACAIGKAILVRLVMRDAANRERASGWSIATTGSVLTLTSVADTQPSRVFLLEGAQSPLAVDSPTAADPRSTEDSEAGVDD